MTLDSEVLWLGALVPAGFVAGVVNVLAGGGSFLTIPLLMLTGVPIHVANGTNRVAVVLQAVVATRRYQKVGEFDGELYKRLIVPTLLGALVGAALATRIDPARLQRVFGVLFLAMALVLLSKGRLFRRARTATDQASSPGLFRRLPAVARHGLFFVIGVYGGFLQAGVGLWILLSSTAVFGVDALRANTVKLPLVMTFTLPALLIFAWAGQVDWVRGLLLAVGTVGGTLVGVRLTLEGGARLILRAVTLVLFGTGVYLLFGRVASAS